MTAPAAPAISAFIRPMLAAALPEGTHLSDYAQGWAAEEKFDGHRVGLLVQEGRITAWKRSGRRTRLPAHLSALATQLLDGYYDGELLSREGGRSYELSDGSNTGHEVLYLFDALHLIGGNCMTEPYSARREKLELAYGVLPEGTALRLTEPRPCAQVTLDDLWGRDREGVILKRLASPYRPGDRSGHWLKIKRLGETTVRITRFGAGESGPCSVAFVEDLSSGRKTSVKVPTNELIRQVEGAPAAWIGTSIEIEFQERTEQSFRHPRWKRVVGGD